MTGFCPIADANVRMKTMGKMTIPGETCAIAHEEDEEHHHRQECQDGFRIVDRSQRKVTDQDGGFDQRNEVEDKPQPDGRLHHLGQNIALLAEQKERIEQPHAIANDRDSKPD